MSVLRLILTGVGGLLFVIWAVLMFRTLFELRRRGAARSGAMFPGPGETLYQWGQFLRSPEDRSARRRLGLLTLLLLGWNAFSAALPV